MGPDAHVKVHIGGAWTGGGPSRRQSCTVLLFVGGVHGWRRNKGGSSDGHDLPVTSRGALRMRRQTTLTSSSTEGTSHWAPPACKLIWVVADTVTYCQRDVNYVRTDTLVYKNQVVGIVPVRKL